MLPQTRQPKDKTMQAVFNKVLDKYGIKAFIYLSFILALVSGMLFAKNATATYLYQTFTAPFLK